MLFDQGGDKLSNIATICQTDQPLREALEVPQNSDKSSMKGLVVYLVMPPAASAGLGSFEAREVVTGGVYQHSYFPRCDQWSFSSPPCSSSGKIGITSLCRVPSSKRRPYVSGRLVSANPCALAHKVFKDKWSPRNELVADVYEVLLTTRVIYVSIIPHWHRPSPSLYFSS